MKKFYAVTTSIIFIALTANAQSGNPKDTEVWIPVPKVIAAPENPQVAPADAIILFDGKNLDEWVTVKDKVLRRNSCSFACVFSKELLRAKTNTFISHHQSLTNERIKNPIRWMNNSKDLCK